MLVHICCSVDSFYFIKKLKEQIDEKIVGFFYDPNIHPYSEYYLRMIDSKRSCKKLGVEFIEGDYDFDLWIDAVRGFESEPEKGKRCLICFDKRLDLSAKKALSLGEKKITTTLLMSPKKDFSQLLVTAKKVEEKYGVEFCFFDFRKNGGTQKQFLMAKDQKAYQQNYCGCMFALRDQRSYQERSISELYCDINKKLLPNSIEERIVVFEKRENLEEQNINYEIFKRSFLNYRLLYAIVLKNSVVLESYFLFYSYSKQKKFSVEIDRNCDIFYDRRSIFITLDKLNMLSSNIKNFTDLKSISIKEEIELREKLGQDFFDLTPIIVLEKIIIGTYKVVIDSEVYQDAREVLVEIS